MSLRMKRPSDPLALLMLTIRLGINNRSFTEGCFSTTKDRNKTADARKQFVSHALRIVFLGWCRDVVRSYISNPKKSINDSFTVVPDRRL